MLLNFNMVHMPGSRPASEISRASVRCAAAVSPLNVSLSRRSGSVAKLPLPCTMSLAVKASSKSGIAVRCGTRGDDAGAGLMHPRRRVLRPLPPARDRPPERMCCIDRLSRRQRQSVLKEMASVQEDVFAERRARAEAMGAQDAPVTG